MKYLVTGVNGQLGYDVVKELNSRGIYDVVECDRNVLDITNEEEVKTLVYLEKPDVVIHCAAYTAVDNAQVDGSNAYNVNALGTKYLSEVTKEIGSKMIYVSTDYVFDGTKKQDEMYGEYDKCNPKSIYGKTKRFGEMYARKNPKSFVVRTSWVFGINGNNFVKTMLKLSEKYDKLTVVSDQVGSPTYTIDLAKTLVDMSLTDNYGIYHVNNEGYCSWAEFASYILKDTNTVVIPVTTEEYYKNNDKIVAPRPFNSKLSKKELDKNGFSRLRNWKDAVDAYKIELSDKLENEKKLQLENK